MAALILPIVWLVDTLRRWWVSEQQVAIEAEHNATADLYDARNTTFCYLPPMTVLLAAVAVFGLGVHSADADGGAGPTLFTMIEAQLAAKAQEAPRSNVTSANGGVTYLYDTRPHSQGTWLFAPNENQGANH